MIRENQLLRFGFVVGLLFLWTFSLAQFSIGFGGGGDLNDMRASRWYLGTEKAVSANWHIQGEIGFERKLNKLELPALPEIYRFSEVFFNYMGSQFLVFNQSFLSVQPTKIGPADRTICGTRIQPCR